jgi:hypothetical protein
LASARAISIASFGERTVDHQHLWPRSGTARATSGSTQVTQAACTERNPHGGGTASVAATCMSMSMVRMRSHGRRPPLMDGGATVIGHEFCGTVVELAPAH